NIDSWEWVIAYCPMVSIVSGAPGDGMTFEFKIRALIPELQDDHLNLDGDQVKRWRDRQIGDFVRSLPNPALVMSGERRDELFLACHSPKGPVGDSRKLQATDATFVVTERKSQKTVTVRPPWKGT